jgi:hypothetical protein
MDLKLQISFQFLELGLLSDTILFEFEEGEIYRDEVKYIRKWFHSLLFHIWRR